MSSMWSSWRCCSPAMARASSGSNPAMVIVFLNMHGAFGKNRRVCRAAHYCISGQPGDDFGPGFAEIAAVIATAAERQHAPVAQARRQLHQVMRRTPMHGGAEAQMRDGIPLD